MFSRMKVEVPFYMPRKHRRVVDIKLHSFLPSTPNGDEWSASRPCRFTYGKQPNEPIEQGAGWTPEQVWTF